MRVSLASTNHLLSLYSSLPTHTHTHTTHTMEIPLKFVLLRTSEHRRIRLACPTMAAVQATVRQWVSGPFALRYTDDEGDVVTMEGEDEWAECVALWAQAQTAVRPAPLLLRVEPQRAAALNKAARAGGPSAGGLLRRARKEAVTGRPATAAACVAAAAVAATTEVRHEAHREDSARSSRSSRAQQAGDDAVAAALSPSEWPAALWEDEPAPMPKPTLEPLGNPWAPEVPVEAEVAAGAEAAAPAAAAVPEAEQEEEVCPEVAAATLAWPAEEEARPEAEADRVVPAEAAAAATTEEEAEAGVCPNCDYAVTGVHPTNCCFLCSVRPGSHGRRCLRQEVGRIAERGAERVVVEEYASQQAALRSMGFCDREQCERVLRATRGDTQMAVDMLFAQ